MSDLSSTGPINQCVAHKKNGERCKRAANHGMTVCNSHGGRAPQVRAKAQQRILEASDKAAARLVQMMKDPAVPYGVQLAAARDLLDRANVVGTQQVQLGVELSTFDRNLKDVMVIVDYMESDADETVDAEVIEDEPDMFAIGLARAQESARPGERPDRNVKPSLRPRRPVVRNAAPPEPATDEDASPLGQPAVFASDDEWRKSGRERAKHTTPERKLQPRKRRT